MKKFLSSIPILIALACAARAEDTTVKLSNVHVCCGSCVKGVDKAVSSVSGASDKVDKDQMTVTITASDRATAQKAVDAIVAAGYFGTSSDPDIKVVSKADGKKGKIQSLKISGVHLCCGKCVNGVNDALGKVSGVTGNTATKGAESFEIKGDFETKDVLDALHKAGFSGKLES